MNNKNCYLIYIDESAGNSTHCVYSALFVDAFRWNECLSVLVDWREEWLRDYDIPMAFELHATNFISGRDKKDNISSRNLRADLFYEAIGRVGNMKDVLLISSIAENKGNNLALFKKMLISINDFLKQKEATGILICDEGNERRLTALVRKMKKVNVAKTSSRSAVSKNPPLKHIIEDPLFKSSHSSYFIQLADFLALALLRNENPLPQTHSKIRDAFNQLDRILVKQGTESESSDKGIVRG